LELAGFTPTRHLRLNDLGFAKGNTEASAEAVAKVAEHAQRIL